MKLSKELQAILFKAGILTLDTEIILAFLREHEIFVHVSAWKNMDHNITYSPNIRKHVIYNPIVNRSLKGLDILEDYVPDSICRSFDKYEDALELGIVEGLKLLHKNQ